MQNSVWMEHRERENEEASRDAHNWTKPDKGTIKLNCDASISTGLNSDMAGLVVIARDCQGLIVDFASKRKRVDDILVVEMEAIRLAMQVELTGNGRGSKSSQILKWQFELCLN